MGVVSSKSAVKEVRVPQSNQTESDRELNLETVQLSVKPVDTNLKKVDQPAIQQVDRKNKTDKNSMPITEAEKMRELYRKDRRSLEFSGGKGTIKKESEKNRGRQQYKTSGYHETGRQAELPKAEDTVIPKLNLSATQTNASDEDQEPTRTEKMKSIGVSAKSPVTSNVSPSKLSSKNPKSLNLARECDGSLLSNTFSHHCPGLLERRSLDSSLKPLVVPQSNQVRGELEKQGFLTNENRASIGQVDPKQEGIIGELRQMGLIQKVTSDDVYTMSNGLPKRRPPPRLCHLPPLTNTDSDSPSSSETDIKKTNVIDKILLSKDTEKTTEDAPEHEPTTDSEYFGTLGTENVGDAEKLKLKLIDVDML